MKLLRLFTLCVLISVLSIATTLAGQVKGYYRSNGTYVQPYQRSNPDSTVTNNYSFKGNVNPYTGQTGTNYYRNSPSSPYYNPSSNINNNSLSGSSSSGYKTRALKLLGE